ncbi:MAG: hypothetical protein ACI915_002887 [Gammaproteobacteria bacterium]|jgi:hypothetical protein
MARYLFAFVRQQLLLLLALSLSPIRTTSRTNASLLNCLDKTSKPKGWFLSLRSRISYTRKV